MSNTGTIFDLKEFAVYDGPGIRQTVFLKGCPLRCNWCHNPEGLETAPNLMVSEASCLHCGACKAVCFGEDCTACGRCVQACPLHLRSIAGETLTAQELAERILRNSDYYARYGGGVTFSGGEPLLQAAFVLETMRLLPGVHKAVETCGEADAQSFSALLSQADYLLMDVKLVDRTLHKVYTGIYNDRILANLQQLCQGTTPFIIRIPLIPGVNDNDKNFRQTAQLIAGAPMLEQVELLPYHKTAGAKYGMAGKAYRPLFDPDRPVYCAQHIFEEYGIRSRVL